MARQSIHPPGAVEPGWFLAMKISPQQAAQAGRTRVSLVTPVYNQGDFVAHTIDSVLQQDYPGLEYIVVDDGSTDSTPQVLDRYRNRCAVIRQANAGQSGALNRGWSAASGEYLGYLSSDDLLEPNAIGALAQALDTNPDCVVAYGDYYLIDAAGSVLRLHTAPDYHKRALEVDLICQPGAGVLFRRSVFESLGGWNPDLRQVADFEFWLRASRLGSFVRVASPLARHRIHDASASLRWVSPERSEEILTVVDNHWQAGAHVLVKRARAQARLLAARSHLNSRRLAQAGWRWWEAIRLRPALVLEPMTWRLLGAGALRRWVYRNRRSER
jgi:glycosyltransferase involved in cell wall biosynthesis